MKIFLSSTSYDLFDLRAFTVSALQEMGHEVIFHESPTFPAMLNSHSHDQCLQAVQQVDLVLCLVDRRYGGRYAGAGNPNLKDQKILVKGKDRLGRKKNYTVVIQKSDLSITWMELITAYQNAIPVVTFARQRTLDEKETRRANQFLNTFLPSYVESNQLFNMLDWITKQNANNWIVSFNTIVDFQQKLQTWVKELDKTIASPNAASQTDGDQEKDNVGGEVNRFAVIVEGEVDRLFVSELVQSLQLNAHFVIIPAYGKQNVLNSFNSIVAPYSKIFKEVIVLLDSDTFELNEIKKQGIAITKLIKQSKCKNISPFLASPSIEAWISAGLDIASHDEIVMDKNSFRKHFGNPSVNHIRNLIKHKFSLDNAINKNKEFSQFVEHLASIAKEFNQDNKF